MAEEIDVIEEITSSEYKYGFVTDIETEKFEIGINEEINRARRN
jgi:Fe-S cluster assembly protein SufB